MSERYGGLVFDIDNTFYDHKSKTIPRLAREALGRLIVPGMAATGRSYPLVTALEKHGYEPKGLASLDSGATIADFDKGGVVWERWLKADKVTEVVRKVGGKTIEISASTLKQRVNFRPNEIDSRFTYGQKSPSVFAVYDLAEKERIAEMLDGIDEVKTKFMRNENSKETGCFQVTYAGIDKQSGVTMLLEMAGLENELIAGIGDDYVGDGPMMDAIKAMKRPGTTIAMGNADELLKKKTDMTVASVSDTPDGFTEATRRLGLVA